MTVKMKLTKEQKVFRKQNKKLLEAQGAKFLYDGGGRTYLFCPIFPGSNTYHMTTAICHPNDEISKKYGEWVAIENFTLGNMTTVAREFLVDIEALYA